MRGTSSSGMEDMPTLDFMKWNGVRFSKHQDGGDRLKNLESRYGKPERTVTKNRNTSVTENRNTSWNNRYGKPEHIDGATVTENRSRSYKPCGAGRALSERTGSNRKPVERMKPDRSGTSSMSDRGRDSGRLWLVLRTARSTTPLLGSGHHGLRLVLGSRWTPSAAFGLAPLEERKRELAKLLRKAGWALHFNEHTDEPGDIVFRHACKMGLEGIVVADSGPILKTGETPTPIAPALYPGCRGFAPDPVWKKGKNPKSNFWDFSVFQLSRLPRNARDSAALANEIGSSKHQQTSRQSYSEILSSV